jgi:tetratricopeptide (TPR) repeat protein
MSFQGDISSLAMGDLFQNLAANQKTGTLTIQRQGGECHIQFLDGKIISYTDSQGFSIAEWLTEKEIITRDQLEEVVKRYRKAKKKSLGEILRDLGILKLEEYQSYFLDLVKETLYEVLSFREGTFEFHEGNLDEKLSDREARCLRLQLVSASILMEAARRTDDWQRIRLHIPTENEIYFVQVADRERLLKDARDDLAREAIRLLDGTRTLRQVIGQLPYSRFDACGVLAQLIAEKKIRPLDGSLAIQRSKGDEDPKQAIPCLKTILEREPNNRQILQRLAQLLEQEGERDESAKYNKLLAISLLEEGNLVQAEQHLKKSLELSSKDIVTWQKLWDVVRRQGDRAKMALLGDQFAEHFKSLGLMEIARDHLIEMVKLFPERTKYRVELADARFALGEQKSSVQDLFEVARDLLKKHQFDDAEKVFARILKYDHSNQKAKELYNKIRSGKLARRRAFQKKFLRATALGLLIAAASAFIGYDYYVRGELFRVTRTVFADSLLENRKYDEAVARIKAIKEKYPYSLASFYDAPMLLQTLREKRAGGQKKDP